MAGSPSRPSRKERMVAAGALAVSHGYHIPPPREVIPKKIWEAAFSFPLDCPVAITADTDGYEIVWDLYEITRHWTENPESRMEMPGRDQWPVEHIRFDRDLDIEMENWVRQTEGKAPLTPEEEKERSNEAIREITNAI